MLNGDRIWVSKSIQLIVVVAAGTALVLGSPSVSADQGLVHEEFRQQVAQEMVENAIMAFDADAESALMAIQDTDNMLFHDNELYVYVLDGDNVMVAHGVTPDLVGTDFDEISDTQGTNIGELFTANRSPYGKWVEYYWPNPATETEESELKISWNKFHAGHTFGVGIYPGSERGADITLTDADRERQRVAMEMTEQAIAAFGMDRDAAIAAVQDPDNQLYHDNELYVVIVDSDNVLVAHGADPGLAGEDGDDMVDAAGNNLGDLFESNASPYGRWVENYRTNPATDSDEEVLKYSWAKTRYGHTFIVGIYPGFAQGLSVELSDADRERQRIGIAMVDQAIAAFAADRESTITAIHDPNNPLYHDGELYVFILDGDNVEVANGADPSIVGIDTDGLLDSRGTDLGALATANKSPYGKWVEYYWPNPATETEAGELKLGWIKVSSGYTFGTGIYPGNEKGSDIVLTDADRERQRIGVAMVDQAIAAFAADRESTITAIHDPNNPLYHDGELYVFILDGDNVEVANGADPSIVGIDTDGLLDSRGTDLGALATANKSPYGKWVEYYWPNPATETEVGELKLGWIKVSSGYTFGTGIYPDQPAMVTIAEP